MPGFSALIVNAWTASAIAKYSQPDQRNPNSNLLNLVRSTEAVEELTNGNPLPDCREQQSQIHNPPDACLCDEVQSQSGERHNVRVIAKDVQCMGCNGTCADGKTPEAARRIVHSLKHEQEVLRSGVSKGSERLELREL